MFRSNFCRAQGFWHVGEGFQTILMISRLPIALSNPATVHNVATLWGNATALLLPVLSAVDRFVVNGVLKAVSVVFLLPPPRPPRTARAPTRAHPGRFDIFPG